MLSSSSTRVMVNGHPGERIWHARGLRQGDPISPMLFILAMDVLTAMIRKVEAQGPLDTMEDVGIKHRLSLYADDVVLFARPVVRELVVIKEVFQIFGEASGLRVNMMKSSIIPIRCAPELVDSVLPCLPCTVASFPCRYLGMPLSPRNLKKEELQQLIDQIANQLQLWQCGFLTEAGRVVLINSVMTATAIYHMLSMDLPPWVLSTIDKIRRSFLWRGTGEAKAGHCKVAWNTMCRPKELGGLGIHNLRLLNAALRVRWAWLVRTDPARP